jgi:hypothetical protein
MDDNDELQQSETEITRDALYEYADMASIILLVFGGMPSEVIPWQGVITGYVLRKEGDHPKVICVRSPHVRPDQLNFFQDPTEPLMIEGTKDEMRKLMLRIFTEKDFTNTIEPLAKNIDDDRLPENQRWLDEVAEEVAIALSGLPRSVTKPDVRYGNPTLCVTFPPGESKLTAEIKVRGSRVDINRLLGRSESQLRWEAVENALATIEPPSAPGSYRQWFEELEAAIAAIRSEQPPVQFMKRLIGHDKRVYRPELEKYEAYGGRANGRLEVDISFSQQIQQQWLTEASPEAAVAHNLTIAARIRHDIVDRFVGKVSYMPEGDWEALDHSVKALLADGAFFQSLAASQLNYALGEDELQNLNKDFGTKILGPLLNWIENRDRAQVESALKDWSANNLEFFRLGLNWYAERLGIKLH